MLDIIVPVFNQKRLVEECLAAAIATTDRARHEIVVIDDASSDAELRQVVRALAASGSITLLVNEVNAGFTPSVNRGMRLHPDRDVILLNSDTVVFGDWTGRLAMAAYADARIATANPLSNATHIGTYPGRRHDGDVRLADISDEQLDQLASETNAGLAVDVHTSVGFCMYIKRACLREIGLFDEVLFPVGYGEESDFCYRAKTLGWRHVIAADIFVRHWEARSFGAERREAALLALHDHFVRLHPDLVEKDGTFWELDPMRPAREALDLARLRRLLGGAPSLACVLAGSPADAVHLRFDVAQGVTEFVVAAASLPNLPRFAVPAEVAALNGALARLGVATLVFASAADRAAVQALLAGEAFELALAPALSVQPRRAW